ncbi:MAG TPA: hypothetical protein VM076_03035 [Gemmatimonadaceae bacterium]|nr:hypothetical protein [Gemmatimonadaceae bacterium]
MASTIGYQAGSRSACVIEATAPNVLSTTAMMPRMALLLAGVAASVQVRVVVGHFDP